MTEATIIKVEIDHYHVVAVQDRGGSQEYWRGWDDQWTREQAEAHAHDMIEADNAYVGAHCEGLDIDAYEAAQQRFGDRMDKLISTNVAPGWNAIWVEPCGQPCGWNVNQIPMTAPWWVRMMGGCPCIICAPWPGKPF